MQKSPEPSGAEYKHMLMKYFPSKSEASVRKHTYLSRAAKRRILLLNAMCFLCGSTVWRR